MFAQPITHHNSFPITLPPIEKFGRPIWAYNHLGWDLLRRHLFGETKALMKEIAGYGETRLSGRQLENIVRVYQVHDTVRVLLIQFGADQPASDIHAFYKEWEDLTFEDYLHQAKNRGR